MSHDVKMSLQRQAKLSQIERSPDNSSHAPSAVISRSSAVSMLSNTQIGGVQRQSVVQNVARSHGNQEVMRVLSTIQRSPAVTNASPPIQRKCTACERAEHSEEETPKAAPVQAKCNTCEGKKEANAEAQRSAVETATAVHRDGGGILDRIKGGMGGLVERGRQIGQQARQIKEAAIEYAKLVCHGNWCGPSGLCSTGATADVDNMDTGCHTHDDAYSSLKVASGSPKPGEVSMWSSAGLIKTMPADQALVASAEGSRSDPRTNNPKAAKYRENLKKIFGTRIAIAQAIQAVRR